MSNDIRDNNSAAVLDDESPELHDEASLRELEEEALEEGITVFGEAPIIPVIEAALMAFGKPMTLEQLAALFDEDYRPDKPAMKQAMEDLTAMCDGRGFELKEVASGWRFQVRQELAPWVGRMWDEKPQRYTRALLETLALVAYRQPITRGEIEDIRGVSVSTNIIRTLQEREWVRVVGYRDVPGRPAMYATTRQFLDYFNLRNLDELPPLSELRDLEAMAKQLEAAGIPGTESLFDSDEASAEGEGEEQAGERDAADMVSIEEAQAFQEAGNQNIDRLFAELDEMEGSLTTTYNDYNPLTDDKPEDEIATRAASRKRNEPEANVASTVVDAIEQGDDLGEKDGVDPAVEAVEATDVESVDSASAPPKSPVFPNLEEDDDDDFELYHSKIALDDDDRDEGDEDEDWDSISSLIDELDADSDEDDERDD